MTKIEVPQLGESVSEAIVAKWLKKEGESVARDEPLVELETDKVTIEVNAPEDGVLSSIDVAEGETVEVGAILGELGEGSGKAAVTESKPAKVEPPKVLDAAHDDTNNVDEQDKGNANAAASLSPAVRKMVNDNNLDASTIKGTGKDGRLTKEDVQNHIDSGGNNTQPGYGDRGSESKPENHQPTKPSEPAAPRETKEREERVRMSKLRQTIAKRLKEAQTEAAILTTFNEIDMGAFMDLRKQYKDGFEKKHGVKLGFMSIFVKAAVQALKEFPSVNAEIDGTDIVYKNYYDIGVAVSTPQGLVVPNVRDADQKSFADIEKDIGDLAGRARDGKLSMSEMTGGTFTITNGGVFGSMMSTPILNRPQSAILGMHKTQMRPVVMPDGSIQARPMMYVALSYDHRIVDGRESVSFLVRIKEALEDPARLLIEA
jgi:2-oxoglutarate dehydrogenase E2 component (dihydrolipoamide succinyltransferase)